MITNDEAMDSVCDAMTFIDSTLTYDTGVAKDLVLRLRETIKWVELQVEGQWEEKEN
tara:strand:- start:86 stop:256 length:171 start_codon:yes stop_codon:yes gene_type:complete